MFVCVCAYRIHERKKGGSVDTQKVPKVERLSPMYRMGIFFSMMKTHTHTHTSKAPTEERAVGHTGAWVGDRYPRRVPKPGNLYRLFVRRRSEHGSGHPPARQHAREPATRKGNPQPERWVLSVAR